MIIATIMELKLYPQQQQALDAIRNFLESDTQVFILKGYAGTGKTTMIKALIPVLQNLNKQVQLMAPTGRAAKILKSKTGLSATTIHSAIYAGPSLTSVRHNEVGELIKMEDYTYKDKEESRKHDIMQLWFGIDPKHYDGYIPERAVYIVDEASMVSSRKVEQEVFHFGSDILLDDLLEYAELLKGGKIIFVGDPAQLPPVGDNRSAALDEEYFSAKNISVATFELTDVIRQERDSAILENAMMVRDVLKQQKRNTLSFHRKPDETEDISATDIVIKFTELYPEPLFGSAAILCYSNRATKGYNDAIRTHYFSGEKYIQPGDILQVVRNCYSVGLFNGDFVRVLDVSPNTETQSAPVWTKIGGKREVISLTFRDITIQTDEGAIHNLKIIDSLLNNSEPHLSVDEHTALYINFRMRHPNLPNNREIVARALMEDPYYSALNVKYGYAITGHKSQGGDWDTVFVDYAGRIGLDDDSLRWTYTATTRAKKRLYGANMHNVKPFDKLTIRTITKASKPAPNALSIADMGVVEWLGDNATNTQKAKYLSVAKALERIDFKVERVERLQYKDRYHIVGANGVEKYDCTYNGSGYYTAYQPLQKTRNTSAILEALHSDECYEYQFDYTPHSDTLAQLYARVQSSADEIGVKITNVTEEIKQYFVVYHLKTSGQFSRIKFYFDKNNFITYAQPESDLGTEDALLQKLIEKLA